MAEDATTPSGRNRDQPLRVGVVVNPTGRGVTRAMEALDEACAEVGWQAPLVRHTTIADPGPGQAAALIAEGVDHLVVLGGDGTVRAVAAVLGQAGERGREVSLGVVATGTANLLARCLDLPLPHRPPNSDAESRRAVRLALGPAFGGTLLPMDLGLARLERADGTVDEQVFTVVAGAGMDAAAFARTTERSKSRFGWIAYFASLVAELGGRAYRMQLQIDDEPSAVIATQSLLLGNGGTLPLGISLIPQAQVVDGKLDLLLIQPRTVLGWVPAGIGVLTRTRGRFSGLHDRTVDTLTLRTHTPIPVHLDGDPVGDVVAMTGRVWPGAIRVSSPAHDPVAVADRIHQLQKWWTRRFDELEVAREFLALKGNELTRLKSLVRSRGGHHDLEKLIFTDIDDEQLRATVLDHFAVEGEKVRRSRRAPVRVLSDIDDTLRSSLHDKRFPRGVVYPGVVAFYRAIDSGESADPESPGDLTFLTARPAGPAGLVENLTRDSLAELGLPPHSVLSGTLTTLISHGAMARRKMINFARHRQLFPEADLVFVGDSGQGDVAVGTSMLDEAAHVARAVFIHDVVPTPPERREFLRSKGIHVFDTYLGAALAAHEDGLVDRADLADVAAASRRDLAAIDFDDAEQRAAAEEQLRRDLERLAALGIEPGLSESGLSGSEPGR